MKRILLTTLLFSTGAFADVRICEELKSSDITAVICPQTLDTLIWLAPLPGDNPGVMNLSLKTLNTQAIGFRVTVWYFRTLDHAEVSVISGYIDANKTGGYATLPLMTGRIGGIQSIEVMEIRPSGATLFGN